MADSWRFTNKAFSSQLKRGLETNITAEARLKKLRQGEPVYMTDTKRLFISDGNGGATAPNLIPTATQYGIRTVTTTADDVEQHDSVILLDTTSNAVTLTLPPAADTEGRVYIFKAIDITNTATIDGNASETIDGATTYVFTSADEAITIISDGTNWQIIGKV